MVVSYDLQDPKTNQSQAQNFNFTRDSSLAPRSFSVCYVNFSN